MFISNLFLGARVRGARTFMSRDNFYGGLLIIGLEKSHSYVETSLSLKTDLLVTVLTVFCPCYIY